MGNMLSNLLVCSSNNTECKLNCDSKNNSRNSSNIPYHIINKSEMNYFEI